MSVCEREIMSESVCVCVCECGENVCLCVRMCVRE